MALTVIHEEEAHRFITEAAGMQAVPDYRLQGTRKHFLHTGVPPSSFVTACLRPHPEYGR